MRLNLGPFPEVPRCPQRTIEEPIPITEDPKRKEIEEEDSKVLVDLNKGGL